MTRIRRYIVSSVVVLSLVWSLPVCSQPVASAHRQVPSFSSVAHQIRVRSGGVLGLSRLAADGSPNIIVASPALGHRIVPEQLCATPSDVQNVLQDRAGDLRDILSLPTNAVLTVDTVQAVSHVWRARFYLSYQGIPVRDRSLVVTIGKHTGQYVSLVRTLPIRAPEHSGPSVIPESLTPSKLRSFVESGESTIIEESPQLVYLTNELTGIVDLAYEWQLRDTVNAHLWRLRIDAQSGELLDRQDLYESVVPTVQRSGRITAWIHPHSTFDSSVRVGLPNLKIAIGDVECETDSDGYWSAITLDTVPNYSVAFSSRFASIVRADTTNSLLEIPVNGGSGEWSDSNSSPAERDAYYSVALAHRFAKSLDSTAGIDLPVVVRVNLSQSCNAYYDPTQQSLNFFKGGNNCSNTAEIADVVYHEYGHRVIHTRYGRKDPRSTIVNSSLGEAFADVFSALMRDDSRIGIGFFSNNCFSTLRDCFNTKSYPWDISPDPHTTGQIIAGALWDVRRALGRSLTVPLFSSMLDLGPDAPNGTSVDDIEAASMATLLALLTADDSDNDLTNGTPHMSAILGAFSRHGITLSNFIRLEPQIAGDQDSLAASYPVKAVLGYNGQIGSLSDSSVRVNFSFDNGQSWQQTTMLRLDDSVFQGVIPKAPAGTVVKYFFSAGTTVDNGGIAFVPSIFAPSIFLVGYNTTILDDAEVDHGWRLSAPTDKATSGLWVRGIPHGTFDVPGHYIQQDTDHTPNGVACYMTGNRDSVSIYDDDVDSGSTTLITPSYDLSNVVSPVIRYWYYYNNSIGFFAGRTPFVAEISSDDGQTWKSVQSQYTSTDGWQSYTFRVSDKIAPSSTVRMRFVATDYFATVTEAGVDDFQILSGAASQLSGVAMPKATGLRLSNVHPNPTIGSSSATFVSVATDVPRHVVVTLRDVQGNVRSTLLDQRINAGAVEIRVPTQGLESGTYWLVLNDGRAQSIRRFVVR